MRSAISLPSREARLQKHFFGIFEPSKYVWWHVLAFCKNQNVHLKYLHQKGRQFRLHYTVFRKKTPTFILQRIETNRRRLHDYLIITRKLLSKYLIQKSQSVLEMYAILSNIRLIIFLAQYEIFNFTDIGSRACTVRGLPGCRSILPVTSIF